MKHGTTNQKLNDAKVAAERLGSSVSSLKAGRRGEGSFASLEYVRIGRSIRYTDEAIEAFIARLPKGGR